MSVFRWAVIGGGGLHGFWHCRRAFFLRWAVQLAAMEGHKAKSAARSHHQLAHPTPGASKGRGAGCQEGHYGWTVVVPVMVVVMHCWCQFVQGGLLRVRVAGPSPEARRGNLRVEYSARRSAGVRAQQRRSLRSCIPPVTCTVAGTSLCTGPRTYFLRPALLRCTSASSVNSHFSLPLVSLSPSRSILTPLPLQPLPPIRGRAALSAPPPVQSTRFALRPSRPPREGRHRRAEEQTKLLGCAFARLSGPASRALPVRETIALSRAPAPNNSNCLPLLAASAGATGCSD